MHLQQIDRWPNTLRDETATLRQEIAAHLQRHTGNRTNIVTPFRGVMMAELHEPTPPMSYIYEPSLSLIIQGEKRVSFGDTLYTYNESRFFLTAVNLPTVAEVPYASAEAPFMSLLLQLNLPLAREVIADMEQHGNRINRQNTGMSLGAADCALLHAVLRYLANQDSPHNSSYVSDLIQREILYRILTSEAGSVFRETVLTGTSSQRVSIAINWLRENYEQPLKVEALAQLAGMGVSTLHHHFRRMTTMSPLQFQKQLRLHEARRLLIAEPVDASSAAIRVGYESVTQFHREYKRMFGATPMRDKEQLLAGIGNLAIAIR
ncbi:AraC-type DNA-binding protein [Candidatus Pantoea symbiotica]|jgi:AraC-like DNA-binding protein|uniref:AraC-type DNA-binding protein n=1 Tax=Candidatus Pantoea symbiotica TaxID=1884370 RepID=A0A1I3URM5_9GAMM|nr:MULTISPECIES: AraC family transcriptional regulator [Pantoea]KAJ9431687.1 AraC family transcriptional regulator [Pantoea sp. YR343]MRT24795.1 helix-turn-helix domain-containing protein [Enterobacteriaceae bacterium RIT697]SFJ85403.1 AraC-type DNA-binding protein [Pantoea symbiotica]SFU60558.1 AraC-type DNA-binding protein [Pantoea sp. YR525]